MTCVFQLERMTAELDRDVERLLSLQNTRTGEILREDGFSDTRGMGFSVARMLTACLYRGSRWYDSPDLQEAVIRALLYIQASRRPSGMFDLASCNFDSAPDTAFTVNALLDVLAVLKTASIRFRDRIEELLLDVVEQACRGMCSAGFHTPNHRWAISACLKTAAPYVRDKELSRTMQERADRYLREGLDQDRDGEFTERSAGTYNAVNDDQMIRLYLATGEKIYLEAARNNLLFMRYFLEPDGSLFTQHSTRQDRGTKVWPAGYCILYLLTGWLLQDPELASVGQTLFDLCAAHNQVPTGLVHIMRFPDMVSYGRNVQLPSSFACLFEASGILRVREEEFCVTLRKNAPDFMYVRSGGMDLCMSVYANVCDRRNFAAETLEKTGPDTYELRGSFPGWYYLPFEQPPETGDWRKMDHGAREKEIRNTLYMTVSVHIDRKAKALTLNVSATGLDRVPIRLECGFACGQMRTASSLAQAQPGTECYVLSGDVEMTGSDGSVLTLGPCFARHTVHYRMGGAFCQDPGRCVVCLTEISPCSRTIRIGTEKVYPMVTSICDSEGKGE